MLFRVGRDLSKGSLPCVTLHTYYRTTFYGRQATLRPVFYKERLTKLEQARRRPIGDLDVIALVGDDVHHPEVAEVVSPTEIEVLAVRLEGGVETATGRPCLRDSTRRR